MANQDERSSHVGPAIKNNRFSLSVFGTGGNYSPLSYDKSNHLHHNVDTDSLMHRSHAFSYSPRNHQPLAHAQSVQSSPSGSQGVEDKPIRMTLSTSAELQPRRNRRRSSLFGATADQKKQLPVPTIQESNLGYIPLTKDYGVRMSERRSPRRYSAAQSSLEKISQDTTALLQKLCSSNISNTENEPQSSLGECSSLEPWEPSNQTLPDTWADPASYQNTVSPTSLAPVDFRGNSSFNHISADRSTLLPVTDETRTFGHHESLVDLSKQFLQPSSSHDGVRPQNETYQADSFTTAPNKDIGIFSKSQNPTEKTVCMEDRSHDKRILQETRNQSIVSDLTSGFSNAVRPNQGVSLQNAHFGPSNNTVQENSVILFAPTASKHASPENKTDLELHHSGTQIIPKVSQNTVSSTVVRNGASNIDTGQYEPIEVKNHKGNGLFSWAWSVGGFFGAKSKGDRVEVSTKELNMVAPSSF